VPRARSQEFASDRSESSDAVRARVVEARDRLEASQPPYSEAASALLARAVDTLPLSGRGRARVRRVARTVAALAASTAVEAEHIAEALAYRTPTKLGGAT
jgi:magnesium chelatase family protein